MHELTANQVLYRAYLASPVWKAKRAEALAFHGCICNRCKEWGSDVHHKTYERVGGGELMEDFEVLCRECHEVHHSLDPIAMTKTRRRTIHRRAIHAKLSAKHCQILWNKYPRIKNLNDLFIALNKTGKNEVAEDAAYLLGCHLLTENEANAFGSFWNTVRKNIHRTRK